MANRFLNNIRINDEYTLPSSDGSANQVITTDGSGNLSFIDVNSVIDTATGEVYYTVKNSTGSTLLKGTAVMAVGSDGNSGHILVDKMVGDGSIEPRRFLGVLAEDIGNGNTGKAIHFGQIDQFDTRGQNGETWNDGDILWCDPDSAGDFTITEPDGPNVKISAAIVLNASTNGKIQVRVQANEGVHDLHDTKITSQTDGDVLVWDNTTGVWFNDSTLNVDYTNSRVGIGTTSPSSKLDVYGTISLNGFDALRYDTTSQGLYAGHLSGNNQTRSNAFGYLALSNNTGTYSNGFGYFALQNNTGVASNGFGYLALRNNTGHNSSGFGRVALENNTGTYSNGFGNYALQNNTGNYSNGFGFYALRDNTGAYSNAFGYVALHSNQGDNSNGFGNSSLQNNTGDNSNGFGHYALQNNTGSSSNGFGYFALSSNTGDNSNGFGFYALQNNQGNNNTAIGSLAGYEATPLTGTDNTFLGFNASYGENTTITNSTAVGANVTLTDSNTVILGNGANVGIGTTAPIAKLDVTGDTRSTGFQVNSGGKYKIGNLSQYITGYNDTAIDIVTGGTVSLRVADNGNVGIGTTSPTEKLHVAGNSVISGGCSADGWTMLTINHGSYVGNSDKRYYFRIQDGSSINKLTFTTTGKLLVGVPYEDAVTSDMLQVKGTVSSLGYKLNGVSINTAGTLSNVAYKNQNNLFSTDQTITGSGSTSSTNSLILKNSGGTTMFSFRNDSKLLIAQSSEITFANGQYIKDNGSAGLTISTVNSTADIHLKTNDVTRLTVDQDGKVGIGTTSPSAKLDVQGDVLVTNAKISNQENTDVDTGTEVVATVSIATYTAAFFDFVIKNGTNVRSGTVFACHDGTNVEYTETSTTDLGNTADVTLSVDISAGNMRLLATATTDNWSVKSLVRAL